VASIEIDLDRGVVAGFDLVQQGLASLRARSLASWQALADEDWERPSRCSAWTVHDTVRHVRDCLRIHVARLRREPPPFPDGQFDNTSSPDLWLAETAGEAPAETLIEIEALGAAEAEALAGRDPGSDEVEIGPYGPVQWTTFSTHMFWDAWIHERDVAVALGAPHAGASGEDVPAAAYGLFVATVPIRMAKLELHATLALGSLRFRAMPGLVRSEDAGTDAAAADLRGELLPVLDALAGRGAEVADVLAGDAALVEPLCFLRRFMTP
jgi:uncharacterized protein (TIGR03083 family)